MTTLLINNEAVEHGKLHKVDGHLLVPLQCFARHLIRFQQLVSAVDATHVFIVVSNTGCSSLLNCALFTYSGNPILFLRIVPQAKVPWW